MTQINVGPSDLPVLASRKQGPYEKIRRAILDGEFELGQPMVEVALAKWCGVSRTPIREALLRLEQDGLLIRRDGGLVIRERSREEILDIYETRIALESTVARVAAKRRSSVDLMMLRRHLDVLDTVDPQDGDAMMKGNRAFHRALWRASYNESLIDAVTRLESHLARYPATTLLRPGRWEEANLEHRGMIDAIEQQDSERTAQLAEKHFTTARDLRLVIWSEELASQNTNP